MKSLIVAITILSFTFIIGCTTYQELVLRDYRVDVVIRPDLTVWLENQIKLDNKNLAKSLKQNGVVENDTLWLLVHFQVKRSFFDEVYKQLKDGGFLDIRVLLYH